ncbi:MAG: hypothetical protein KGH87_00610 [Thaumarchaeota archaeon]|nr:hypothetical protein [Candidatus Nitrosotalea sp.]MDE1813252.1 hypothetical protein [Nitrososphaerota archaeon]MDE1838397.1 hypothetical protein [Nitrososphaerota archaeon]
MPQDGQKTVTMSGIILKELLKEYRIEVKKRPSLSFAGFISEYAIMELERRKIVKQAAPLSLITVHDNIIVLKDAREKIFVEVQIKDKKWFCLSDKSDDCIHVGFAMALPETKDIR